MLLTRGRGRAVPLALWLALALVAIVGLPTVTTVRLTARVALVKQQADQAELAAMRRLLGHDVALWRDPGWQRAASGAFAALGVEVALVVKSGLRRGVAFTTPGAGRWAGTAGLLPLAPGARTARAAGGDAPSPPVVFREIPVMAGPGGARREVGVADLWMSRPAAGLPPEWLPLAGGLAALLAALAGAAVGLVRLVLRPLAAMEGAARRIADGHLEVQLPASAAREVATVSAALEMMGAGLREAVRRQEEMEQERRLFIGAIAHDLRTPLFTLSAYLAGLKDGLAATPEKTTQYVAVCQEQTAALERLVADLFAYSRLEYLEQAPRREALDLGALLRRVAERVQPLAATRRIALTVGGPATPSVLGADAQLLTRAIDNLLDNALRYTPPGGHIRLGWARQADALTITVADSGPGIAAEDLPHVFTPLYRAESSRHRETGGAGLGLTIARRILRAHGGDLTASNGPQGGAIFTGTLPLAPCGPVGD